MMCRCSWKTIRPSDYGKEGDSFYCCDRRIDYKKAYVRQGNARIDALVGNSKAFDAGLAALLG